MTLSDKIKPALVKDLHFDNENPRLVEFGIDLNTGEDEILKILWEAMDVEEIVLSLAASGFFPQEPLIVCKENNKDVVIEGNRRLAALKVLTKPSIAAENDWKIPSITAEARKALLEIPVLYVKDRKSSWRYLGFKHVNGPSKWTSFAKAKYIADVHRKYGTSLEDIALQIGDGHGTVQRLYRGLMVLEQAEREEVFDRDDRTGKRIYFSHLYTGLDKEGFRSFLDLTPKEQETDSPVPKAKLKELGEVCRWLYGSKSEEQLPIVKTQNPDLKYLDAVIADREGLAALRGGESLTRAYEISQPSGEVFEQALLTVKRELMRAKSYVSTGYDQSEALLRTAGSIAEIADSVYEEMRGIYHGEEKQKRMTDLED